MLFKSLAIAALLVLASQVSFASDCKDLLEGIQSKETLINLVSQRQGVHVYKFVKDLPVLGFRFTSPRFSDIPAPIRNLLGSVDTTSYEEKYLRNNIGSVFVLQMDGNKPDFYVLDKKYFDDIYKKIDMKEFTEKNGKLLKKLMGLEVSSLISANDPNLVAMLKTEPVDMYRMSLLGYPVDKQIVIQSPWGEQTKPAGQDAFLTYDKGNKAYYMVNVDSRGLPIGYILSYPQGVQSQDFLASTVEQSLAPVHQFVKDTGAAGLKTAPVEMVKMSELGYPIDKEIVIATPWGPQTKPAGQDAYLANGTFTFSGSKLPYYYVVGMDAQGMPIGYIPGK